MSTNPRASTSLTKLKDKRKRSEEGKLEQKRSRTGLIDNQMDTIIPLKTISNPRMAKKIDNVDLITAMMEALSDPRVRGLYVGQFKADCEELIKDAKVEILQEVDDKLAGTSKITDDHEDRLVSLEKTVEKQEQNERSANIVIRGLKPTKEDDLKDFTIKLLSKKLEVRIRGADVKYVTYLGKDVGNARPVKVMFYEKFKRDEIIKRRGLLKGSDIWIGEDLTPKRSRLSYLARQSAKLKDEYKTWTVDGKIYFKRGEDDDPERIDCEDDLPKSPDGN